MPYPPSIFLGGFFVSHPTITGSGAGSFWVRLGHLEGAWLDWSALYGNTATTNVLSGAQVPTRIAQIQGDFAAGTTDYTTVAALDPILVAFQTTGISAATGIQQAVQSDLIYLANADTPLASLDITTATTFLIAAMKADSATISDGTVPSAGAQTANIAASPVGNPVFALSVVDSAGRALQYCYPETLDFVITQDAQGGATPGQEPYSVTGQNANPNGQLAFDWLASKYGSGATGTGNLIDPSVSNTGSSTGNLTVNGTFGSFSNTNYADNWKYVVGVATTNFVNSTGTTTYYAAGTGIGSLELLSDGSNKNDVRQLFNTASGTGAGTGGSPYAFVPSAINNLQYGLFFAYALKTASPTNGTLTVDLCDNNGTTINDDAGVANSLAITLTSIANTSWHTATAAWRLPQALPTGTALPIQLRFRFTGTILDITNAVYLGAVGLATLTQLYAGGEYFVGWRGSTNPNSSGTYPDSWTITVSYTPSKMQRAIWRWINPPSMGAQTPGLMIPNVASGSATISDGLVA